MIDNRFEHVSTSSLRLYYDNAVAEMDKCQHKAEAARELVIDAERALANAVLWFNDLKSERERREDFSDEQS